MGLSPWRLRGCQVLEVTRAAAASRGHMSRAAVPGHSGTLDDATEKNRRTTSSRDLRLFGEPEHLNPLTRRLSTPSCLQSRGLGAPDVFKTEAQTVI